MGRIALMVIRLLFWVPLYLLRLEEYGKKREELEEKLLRSVGDEGLLAEARKNFEGAYAYLKMITQKVNKAGRVTIEARGLENLPEKDGFVFFPNHQGLFDVLVFLESCPRPFSVVIKKEASGLILLKQVVNALGAVPIDRQDIRQSMRVIQKVADEVKKGKNFLIFPEGTRSRKGNQLLDFKGGTFKSAMQAKAPIVPCALIDSFKPFDEKGISPVTVRLIYMKPMYYEEYAGMKTKEIAEEVKKRIEAEIERNLSK